MQIHGYEIDTESKVFFIIVFVAYVCLGLVFLSTWFVIPYICAFIALSCMVFRKEYRRYRLSKHR